MDGNYFARGNEACRNVQLTFSPAKKEINLYLGSLYSVGLKGLYAVARFSAIVCDNDKYADSSRPLPLGSVAGNFEKPAGLLVQLVAV